MDQLKSKSPEMVKKELHMYLIGYSLIRYVMYKSASDNNVEPDRISFKGTVKLFVSFCPVFINAGNNTNLLEHLLKTFYDNVAKLVNPRRSNRKEPRAVKRRLRRHQYLTQNRSVFKETPHRGKRPNS